MLVPFLVALAAPAAAPAAIGPSPTIITPVVTPADPATLAAAYRLLDAIGYEKMMSDSIETMIAGQRARLRADLAEKMGKDAPAALTDRVGAVLEKSLRTIMVENSPEMRKATALIYARYFTAADLERLTVIQKDPVMKRSMSLMPLVMNDIMTLSSAIFKRALPTIKDDIKAAITDYQEANPS